MVAALGVFVYSKLSPRIYESNATIYAQNGSSMASFLSNLPISISTGATGNNYLLTVLKSDTLAISTIDDMKLRTNPLFAGDEHMSLQEALEKFRENVHAKEGKSGGIVLSVRAKDPRLAADIANRMLDGLQSAIVTSSKRKVAFISGKLSQTSDDLEEAEDAMQRFMETNQVASLTDETKSLVDQLSALDGKLLEQDVEIKSVNAELASAGNLDSLVDLEVRSQALQSSRDYMVKKRDDLRARLKTLPSVATKYARLQRRIAVLSKTFELLTEQLQLARITQQGEDGQYQIVDRARPNPKKVAPRVLVNTLVAGIGAFVIIAFAVTVGAAGTRARNARPSVGTMHAPAPPTAGAARRG